MIPRYSIQLLVTDTTTGKKVCKNIPYVVNTDKTYWSKVMSQQLLNGLNAAILGQVEQE